MPASARRRIIAYAFACGGTVRVSLPVPRPIVRNSGPLNRRAGWPRRDIRRGCDDTASRAVCRSSRAASPTAGGSACKQPRPPCRSGRRNRPSARSRRDRADWQVSCINAVEQHARFPGSSIGVCPDVTTWRGLRIAGWADQQIWPVTSQSDRVTDLGEALLDAPRRKLARYIPSIASRRSCYAVYAHKNDPFVTSGLKSSRSRSPALGIALSYAG
jgi:hypothetical protein